MKFALLKKLFGLATVAVISCCLEVNVKAHLIDLGAFGMASPIGNPQEEADFIEGRIPLSYQLTPLGKHDYDTGWEDGAADQNDFLIDPSTPETDRANVSWDLTGSGYVLNYILVKDGRGSGELQYHLYEVHASHALVGGPEEVTINFQKGLSHISFFGSQQTSAPDGGATAALLGLGFLGLAAFGRKRA